MLIGIISVLSAAAAAGLCFLTGGFQDLNWIWQLPVGFAGCFLVLAVFYFLFLWFVCAIVDEEKPQEKDSKFYRAMTNLTAKAAMRIVLAKIHTKGLEKLPKEGRFLLVCNHIHDLDPVALLATFPKSQLAFISKRENDEKLIVGKLMHKILCQLINRENDREALKTILKCIQIIKEDKASSTYENFVFTQKILDEKFGEDYTLCFTTNEFHIYRAQKIARKAGFDKITHIHAPTKATTIVSNGIRECLAVIKYALIKK